MGGLSPLYMAIEDDEQDIDLLRQCAAVISNISENGENQVSLIKEDSLPRLIHLGNIKHPEIQQDVAKTFASLTGRKIFYNIFNHLLFDFFVRSKCGESHWSIRGSRNSMLGFTH